MEGPLALRWEFKSQLQTSYGIVCFGLYTALWAIFTFFNTRGVELISLTKLASLVAVQLLPG